MDVEVKVYDAIRSVLEEDSNSHVCSTATFKKDLGFDQLDKYALLMELEEVFSLRIEDKDFEFIDTVQEAIDYINKRIKEGKKN